ncbi:uncharacterized protein LOC130295368 [Hyla sarda]|uniref:uncharacterized protein LOC130295368 n=1 Tax=Hyla sarda TaxID=327740 RepID=UPI0024C3A2A7|nr:uncharacterized protein LOC130295368 [Hyla sarda]
MDSDVTVFELQNDFSIKQHKVPLKFPRVSKSRLYIVTNQKTQLHLLYDPAVTPRTEGGDHHHEKSIFQYGVSTKMFSVTDPTGTAWEVRLLISPSEISRLSSNYNLTGFVSCLIQELIRVFDVMAELLTVTHQGKRVQIIFRNPCPDNWASGGKKLVTSGETFVFGLCHKVVSLSEAESEIQFLQNLQESYDIVSVFHLSAFVEHLLMTSSWRNRIEVFLKDKDQRKEIITEMSSLAVRFLCSKTRQTAFLKEFQSQMLEKFSSVEAFLVGDEVVCAFGILVSILAAVAAKSIVDRPVPDDDDEEVIIKTIDEDGGEYDLFASPGDWGGVKSGGKSDDVDLGGAESKIGSTIDPETDQGRINGCPKTAEPVAEPPGDSTLDTDDQDIGNDNAEENFRKHPEVKVVWNLKLAAPMTKV